MPDTTTDVTVMPDRPAGTPAALIISTYFATTSSLPFITQRSVYMPWV